MENSLEKFQENVLSLVREFKESVEEQSESSVSDTLIVIRKRHFDHLLNDLYFQIKNYDGLQSEEEIQFI